MQRFACIFIQNHVDFIAMVLVHALRTTSRRGAGPPLRMQQRCPDTLKLENHRDGANEKYTFIVKTCPSHMQ